MALNIALISQGVGVHGHVGHVVARHTMTLRHAGTTALRGKVLAGSLFGRLDLVAFGAVLVSGGRFGSVQAGLSSRKVG